MSDLRRFLLLESERGATDEPRPERSPPGLEARLERVEPVRAASPAPPPAVVDRFAPPPVASAEVELDEVDRRPTTRCVECGHDSGAYDQRCAGCGASLDRPAVRRLNALLWAVERPEREAEDAARRAAAVAELAALTAAHRARATAEVEASFGAILAEHRARTRRSTLIALVEAGRGPLARLSLPWRWAAVLLVPVLAVLALGALGGALGLVLQLVILSVMIVLALTRPGDP